MSELLKAITTGITAFCATNLDDILILMLFFTQVNGVFRRRHIVTGQYLGFAALVLASLSGFFGHFLVPQPWIGLLGIIPMAIGFSRLINGDEEDDSSSEASLESANSSFLSGFLSPQTCGVAAVTFANGGDNIGIYVPLFASSSLQGLSVIIALFFVLVGVWCYGAYQLTRFELIAANITRFGNILVPFVLIGLGVLILVDSHTLENRGLAVLALIISGWSFLSVAKKATVVSLQPEFEKTLNSR